MYDHHTKAGNPGDVVKHVALIAAADAIMTRCRDSFRYADTFAGYAYNQLVADGEWQNGIGAVYELAAASGNSAIRFWHGMCGDGGSLEGASYPGSSIFVRTLSTHHGIAFSPRLWDISEAVISDLTRTYQGQEGEIFPRAATLDDFSGRATDLLLIDPPGYRNHAPFLGTLPRFFDVVDNVILWLPITTERGTESEASLGANCECSEKGLASVSVFWGGERNTKGCRLVYRLPGDAERALVASVAEVALLARWQVLHSSLIPCQQR